MTTRTILALASALALAAALTAPGRAHTSVDPLMGKWDFTGRDSAGVTWLGTLTIGELDPSRFSPNPAKYNHMCRLELQSVSSGQGRETPCLYDPRTGAFSFSGGGFSSKYSYTAAL